MAKSKKGGFMDSLRDGLGKIVSDGLIDRVSSGVDNLIKTTQEKIYDTEEKLIRDLTVLSAILVGAVFLLVGLAIFIENYYPIRKGLGFIIVGIFMFIVSMFLRFYKVQRVR